MSSTLQTTITWADKRQVLDGPHTLPTGEVAYDLEPLYYDRLNERLWEITAEIIENPYRRDYRAVVTCRTQAQQRKCKKTHRTLQQAQKWAESQVAMILGTMTFPIMEQQS